MNRNDKILFGSCCAAFATALLLAFAPNVIENDSIAGRVWSLASSTTFVAILSTFIAAFAGTWGAQAIAERGVQRKQLLDEIRGINMALGLAFNIANTFLVVKKEQILPLCTKYKQQRREKAEHDEARSAARIDPFRYAPDLRTLSAPFTPIQELTRVLLDRVGTCRAQILLAPLFQNIDGLAYAMDSRNSWISEFRLLLERPDNRKSDWYFGVRSTDGMLDTRYPSMIEALEAETDGCIGFALELSKSLREYGEKLKKKNPRFTLPTIGEAFFDKAEEAGLIPDMKTYSEWGRRPD